MVSVVECPTCRGEGRNLRGYGNDGKPIYSGDCGRCGRSGFVPLLDGQPSFPFGRDRDHPALQAIERSLRRATPVAEERTQRGLDGI